MLFFGLIAENVSPFLLQRLGRSEKRSGRTGIQQSTAESKKDFVNIGQTLLHELGHHIFIPDTTNTQVLMPESIKCLKENRSRVCDDSRKCWSGNKTASEDAPDVVAPATQTDMLEVLRNEWKMDASLNMSKKEYYFYSMVAGWCQPPASETLDDDDEDEHSRNRERMNALLMHSKCFHYWDPALTENKSVQLASLQLSNESLGGEPECSPNEWYDLTRYGLITYVGTPMALTGVVCNLILLKLFCKSKSFETPTLYLLVLAILDLIIDLLYVPFFTVDALAIYHQYEFLYHIWHYYAMFMFGTSRLAQFASTYIILCATLERFIVVSQIRSLHFLATYKGRICTVVFILMFAICLRLPAYFEYSIAFRADCPLYMSYDYVPSIASWEHYQLFNFYVMTILHIFVPFALLLILNISIVCVMKRNLRNIGWAFTTFVDMPKVAELLRKESMSCSKKRRDELKCATWTTVAIATTYLCCSSLSLFVSVLENVMPDTSLLYNKDGSSTRFYTLATDAVSILVAVNSLLRLFVYSLCNPSFREQLVEEIPLFKACCTCCNKNEQDPKYTQVGYQNLMMSCGPHPQHPVML